MLLSVRRYVSLLWCSGNVLLCPLLTCLPVAAQGGELELSLLLGDPAAPLGLSGSLGSVVLPEGATGTTPNPKLLTAAHQPINNFKHNIAHIFVSVAAAAAGFGSTCIAPWWQRHETLAVGVQTHSSVVSPDACLWAVRRSPMCDACQAQCCALRQKPVQGLRSCTLRVSEDAALLLLPRCPRAAFA